MKQQLTFRQYLDGDLDACMKVFDANCPKYFAPNEREDYLQFLQAHPAEYELCVDSKRVVGAFGVFVGKGGVAALNWIMLEPHSQGHGVGSIIMARVAMIARSFGARVLHIAASHKSAPFFEKFGAKGAAAIEDGWGPGMHRVDMVLLYEF